MSTCLPRWVRWEESWPGGPGSGALREAANQSSCIGPEGGGRRAMEVLAHLPEHPTSPALPEGEPLVRGAWFL